MRGDLPAGAVTLLFSDVEGSTGLLNELGAEDYAEALAEHRRLLRAAFAAHGGVEVDTPRIVPLLISASAANSSLRPTNALMCRSVRRNHGN